MPRFKFSPFAGYCLAIGVWIFAMTTAQAQDKTAEFATKVAGLLKDYYKFYTAEKIHLTTDKQYYATGEKIWIKAFVGYENPLWTDSLSSVLYVELINSQKQIVTTVLLEIKNNSGQGFIALPEELASDHYHLRAYTSWLRNIGEFTFARVPLLIVNSFATEIKEDESRKQDIQVSFMPEGGQLVKNMTSKVVFRATDGYGRPVAIKGVVQGAGGTKYGEISSDNQGLGAFKMMPIADEALQATIQLSDGNNKVFELPKVKSEGLVLSATHLGKDSIRLQIQHNLNSLSDGSQNYFIIAQAQGKVYFMGASTLESKKITTFIPKRGMPEGILHLMILSEKGKLEAERLVYISKKSMLNIGLSNSATVYKPRESITLQIETLDPEQEPVPAILSVCVLDAAQNESLMPPHSLHSSLWFTSQLLESPANPAYFVQANSEAQQSLDNWLITQKFARFRWDDLWGSKITPWQYPLERGITITGKVYEKKSTTPVAEVNMLAMYGNKQIANAVTDENGFFVLGDIYFIGQDTLKLFAQKGKQKGVFTIEIDKKLPPPITIVPPPLPLPEILYKNLAEIKLRLAWEKAIELAEKDAIMLEAVTVETKKEKLNYDRSDYTMPTSPNQILGPNELRNAPPTSNILFLLQGKVPGLQVAGDPLSPFIIMRGGSSFTPSQPLILFDGVIVDGSFFTGMDASQIESIEVIKGARAALYGSRGSDGSVSTSLYPSSIVTTTQSANANTQSANATIGGSGGSSGSEGVIAVYSKKTEKDSNSASANNLPTKDIDYLPLQGFCENKKVVIPNYEKDKTLQLDVRSTVFWQGDVQTDENGKANLSFFAADLPTNYRVIIQGIAEKGQLAGQQHHEITIAK